MVFGEVISMVFFCHMPEKVKLAQFNSIFNQAVRYVSISWALNLSVLIGLQKLVERGPALPRCL